MIYWISIHSLPKEGDFFKVETKAAKTHFNPLPPQGGRRKFWKVFGGSEQYFNPLPPQGGRLFTSAAVKAAEKFQSTPSPRRETFDGISIAIPHSISIHSLPKEGDDKLSTVYTVDGISIHSLPKEGDNFPLL